MTGDRETAGDNFTTDQRGWASSTFRQPADITALPRWVVAISGRFRYNDDDDTVLHCLSDASFGRQADGRRLVTGADEWRALPGRRAPAAQRCLAANCTVLPTVSQLAHWSSGQCEQPCLTPQRCPPSWHANKFEGHLNGTVSSRSRSSVADDVRETGSNKCVDKRNCTRNTTV